MDEQPLSRVTDAKFAGRDAANNLAAERTRLAYERTIMAWLRTSASLISFGFTIQKFFEIEAKNPGQYDSLLGPSNFGRLMILIGLVILILATAEHRRDMRALRAQYPFIRRSTATVFSAVVAFLGVVAMISAMMRS